MTKQYTIPIFVPHLGCPFDCVFCNQVRITGQSTNVGAQNVKDTIDEYLSYFDRQVKIEVGFFGGSFTGIDEKTQEELLSVARDYKLESKIDGIRLSTRPDFINQEIIDRMEAYKVDTIELGVQSLSDDVLRQSGRGHSSSMVYRASELIKNSSINLGLQMMVGLPGDTYEKSKNTVKEFIKLRPSCVRIYPTLVIKDTNLERQYLDSSYQALEIEEAIEYVADYLMMFESEDINVIRVGLQATENIQLGRDVVAGPFHPSFGQMVKSRIYMKLISENIDPDKLEDSLTIRANQRSISAIVGQKSRNSQYIKDSYAIKKISFIKDKTISNGDFLIDYGKVSILVAYKDAVKKYVEDNID